MKMSLWTLLLLLLAFVSRGTTEECQKPVPKGNVVLTDTALLQNGFPDGSTVTLTCSIGYVVDQGSDTITCGNGEWSRQELTCKKKDCGPPNPTPNMKFHISNGTLFGAYVRPYCDRGYYLQGSSYKQCLASGWTGKTKCLVVTCGNPPEIPHSVIDSNHTKKVMKFEDVIEYVCMEGYTLVGNRSAVCQENGKYSSLPQCKVVTCGNPPEIPHSIIDSNHTKVMKFEDVIEYVCMEGYTLVGNRSAVCQENGKYSSLPQCKVVTCGNPPEIPHSIIDSNHTKVMKFEDVIEYVCMEGYTLVGNRFAVCQETGKYSSLPQCDETVTAFALSLGVSVASVACVIFLSILAYKCFQRQNGSYNTMEGKTTKAALMQKDAFSYKNQIH